MQRFEILYQRAYTANSIVDITNSIESPEPVLYETQQKINFEQEYFTYSTRIGVSIVNDLNVKSYLDKPENEKIATEFINYLKSILNQEEFRDLFYDNKKLAEFFNDYYNKNVNYSNQGIGTDIQNSNINLIESKNSLFNADEKYLKTNSLTNYFTNKVDNNGRFSSNIYNDITRDSDFKNFSGYNENYYINVIINRKNKLVNSDLFSEYFVDKCDGSKNFRKITYKNNYNIIPNYGNLDQLLNIQITNGNNLGPSKSSIDNLKALLPVNFLRDEETKRIILNQPKSNNVITVDEINYNNDLGGANNAIFPRILSATDWQAGEGKGEVDIYKLTRKENFRSFAEWSKWFKFKYKPFQPNFINIQQANEKYIYQQIIDLTERTNELVEDYTINVFYTTPNPLNSLVGEQSFVDPRLGLIKAEFKFVKNPQWDSLDFVGQLYNPLITNQLPITIRHIIPFTASRVIVQYEYFSASFLGPDNGTNSLNLNIPNTNNQNDPTYEIQFQPGDVNKTIFINIYKNWTVRAPIVLSLRPFDNPNQVLQYLVIYLEEFYTFKNFRYNEIIEISNYNKCNLMYNGFVYQNYDDNFLAKYRPDSIPVIYNDATGFTINYSYNATEETSINQKLYEIFQNNLINLNEIAKNLNIPQSSIYNIYVNGAHYYEKAEADSDADITVIADVTEDVKYFTIGQVDFSLYNPVTFQFQMNEFAVPAFNDSEVLSDRNFFQYYTEENKFKIIERISFTTNITRDNFKKKALKISESHFNDSEKFFKTKDFDKFKKRIWNSIRILIFSIQYLQNGKIIDRKAANSYLIDVEKPFENFEDVKKYFYPILKDLRDQITNL